MFTNLRFYANGQECNEERSRQNTEKKGLVIEIQCMWNVKAKVMTCLPSLVQLGTYHDHFKRKHSSVKL
jgi:hypothetical protein